MKLASLSFVSLAPLVAVCAAPLAACTVGDANTAESDWRDSIATSATPNSGCAHASYPDMSWEPVSCTTAPSRAFAVGNGADYAAQSAGLIAKTTGTFLHVTDVATEDDSGTADGYSIQLNSNFMSGTAACNGVAGCMSWAQFVYSSEEQSAFIQNWLIGIGTCPDGTWYDDGQGDCYENSAAVDVPVIGITDLSALKMSGGATTGGKDSLVFANGTEAYTTNESDSVTDLASAWSSSEFNIIGDGGGTEAVFNPGASVTVRIGINDHTSNPPTCVANAGTTGETNNLTLSACKTFVASSPAVEFTESD
jgi:hypothetical protein